MTANVSRRLLTMDETSEVTRVPKSTLRFYRHNGTGPRSFKLGGRVMYREEDVEAWIEEQYQAASVTSQPA